MDINHSGMGLADALSSEDSGVGKEGTCDSATRFAQVVGHATLPMVGLPEGEVAGRIAGTAASGCPSLDLCPSRAMERNIKPSSAGTHRVSGVSSAAGAQSASALQRFASGSDPLSSTAVASLSSIRAGDELEKDDHDGGPTTVSSAAARSGIFRTRTEAPAAATFSSKSFKRNERKQRRVRKEREAFFSGIEAAVAGAAPREEPESDAAATPVVTCAAIPRATAAVLSASTAPPGGVAQLSTAVSPSASTNQKGKSVSDRAATAAAYAAAASAADVHAANAKPAAALAAVPGAASSDYYDGAAEAYLPSHLASSGRRRGSTRSGASGGSVCAAPRCPPRGVDARASVAATASFATSVDSGILPDAMERFSAAETAEAADAAEASEGLRTGFAALANDSIAMRRCEGRERGSREAAAACGRGGVAQRGRLGADDVNGVRILDEAAAAVPFAAAPGFQAIAVHCAAASHQDLSAINRKPAAVMAAYYGYAASAAASAAAAAVVAAADADMTGSSDLAVHAAAAATLTTSPL